MKTLFWYQPADLSADDFYSVDGIAQTDETQRSETHTLMSQITERVLQHPTPWCGQTQAFKLVKGHTRNRDEKGRKMAFLFISTTEQWADFHQQLRMELSDAGLTMDEATEKQVMLPQADSQRWSPLFVGGAIAAILLLVYLFLQSR